MLYTIRNSPPPRTVTEPTEEFTKAIWGEFNRLFLINAFAQTFPEHCTDGNEICGTNGVALMSRLQAELPGALLELSDLRSISNRWDKPFTIFSSHVWDIIEFSYKYVTTPKNDGYHSYWKHNHLDFERDSGIQEFRLFVENTLAAHGMAFQLNETGQIIRLLPASVVTPLLQVRSLSTVDAELGRYLERSQVQFLSRDPADNLEAVKTLWDAFERLKSLTAKTQKDKSKSIEELLGRMSGNSPFIKELQAESRALTDIGNSYGIRHSETYQTLLTDPKHVNYLYLRMLAFLNLAAKSLEGIDLPIEDDIPF